MQVMIPAFHDTGEIVIPEQRLQGTTEQKLQQLDDAIAALAGFRTWLAASLVEPDEASRRQRIAEAVNHLVRFSGAVALSILVSSW